MNEQDNALSYTLTPNLGRAANLVGVGRYSAQMKSTGSFGDAELQEALATASGAKVEFIRYLEELRRSIIENALKDGKKVFVNGIAVMSGLRGSFSSVDGPFDPKRHKLAVTSYTYGDFRDCLKGTCPERGQGRDADLKPYQRGGAGRRGDCRRGRAHDYGTRPRARCVRGGRGGIPRIAQDGRARRDGGGERVEPR